MRNLAFILVLLLTACGAYGTQSQIPMANGVPLYGTAGAGHAQ
jgi:hypothetical protein